MKLLRFSVRELLLLVALLATLVGLWPRRLQPTPFFEAFSTTAALSKISDENQWVLNIQDLGWSTRGPQGKGLDSVRCIRCEHEQLSGFIDEEGRHVSALAWSTSLYRHILDTLLQSDFEVIYESGGGPNFRLSYVSGSTVGDVLGFVRSDEQQNVEIDIVLFETRK